MSKHLATVARKKLPFNRQNPPKRAGLNGAWPFASTSWSEPVQGILKLMLNVGDKDPPPNVNEISLSNLHFLLFISWHIM